MKKRELEAWQIRKLVVGILVIFLVGVLYIGTCSLVMYRDKVDEVKTWRSDVTIASDTQTELANVSGDATEVLVGTYVENLRQISLKDSTFRASLLVWYRWEGRDDLDMMHNARVYRGYIDPTFTEMVKDYHYDGINYQAIRYDVTVNQGFDTKRFPLDSHQLRIYLESDYPAEEVVFVIDEENSGLNPYLSVGGYDIVQVEVAPFAYVYPNNHSDPELEGQTLVTTEIVTLIDINRNSFGLYIKCFIAMWGTVLWVLLSVFLCTYHRIDPLGMIPGALFGTVSNIMIGASLVPDSLSLGLIEFMNIFGVMNILGGTIIIITINRIRSVHGDTAFASRYGKIMFYLLVLVVVLGNIIMPMSAFMR